MNNLFTRFSSIHAKSVTVNSKLFRTIISLKSRNIYFSNNSIYNFQWAEIFSAKQPTRWAHSSIVQNVFSCSNSHRRFMSSFRKSNDNQRSRLSPDYIWDWFVELFAREIFARMSNHWKSAHPCYINPFLSIDSLFLFFVPFSSFEKIADSLHAINRNKKYI